MKFLRKYHKWISLIFTFFFLLFGLSGILLNHRDWLASIEVNRKWLPETYRYQSWNNAAVRGTLKTSDHQIYLYGNLGIWKTDKHALHFHDFNQGIKKGIDNRKTTVIKWWKGQLVAGTFSGLYTRAVDMPRWKHIPLEVKNPWIMDLTIHDDSLFILTRSELLSTKDLNTFYRRNLPPPGNYDDRADLFKTLWFIHSGEIYGIFGKLLVDILGIALIFLTLTGLKIFIDKIVIKRSSEPLERQRRKKSIGVNLKWHNKIGYIAVAFLLINSITGTFLRPPFLILVAGKKVKKIPYTELDTRNPWFDKLRRIHYDTLNNFWVVSTYDGFYYSPDHFSTPLRRFKYQPPASIMGVNVLNQVNEHQYLIGSFEGIFLWNFMTGENINMMTGKPFKPTEGYRRPVGQFQITGYSEDFQGHFYVFDYNRGCIDLKGGRTLPPMPNEIIEMSPLSLWSLALEVHTGRIFQPIWGPLYILIVPLTGLAAVFVLVSGFIIWWKNYRA